MKTLSLSLTLILLSFFVPGFAQQNFVNMNTYGGNGYDGSKSIVVEPSGDYYVTGHFSGIVMFGATMLTSAGGTDIFIAKYNTGGGVVWAVRAGSATDDEGISVAIGNGDSLYVTGFYSGVTTGNFAIAGFGGRDIFLHKLSKTSGASYGILRAGSVNNDEGRSVTFDSKSNTPYVTGFYRNNATFSGAPIPSVGGSDVFTAAAGSGMTFWTWVNVFGSANNDEGHGITVNDYGHIYATGFFGGAMGATPYAGGRDVYVTRHNPAGGSIMWMSVGGAAGNDEANGITATPKGKYIYITGYHTNNATFGLSVLAAVGTDILVSQLDTAGTWGTSTSTGAAGNEAGNCIFYDRFCNTLNTGGKGANAVNFGFGAMAYTNDGIYVAEANPATLAWNWAMRGDGTLGEQCFGISSNGSSNIMICGTFSSAPVTFYNTTMANVNLVNAGNTQVWVGEVQKPAGCVGGGTAIMEKSLDNSRTNAWKLYPNPAKEFCFIENESMKDGILTVRVLDMTGRVHFESQMTVEGGIFRYQLHTDTWKSGLYLIQVIQNEEVQTLKWIRE